MLQTSDCSSFKISEGLNYFGLFCLVPRRLSRCESARKGRREGETGLASLLSPFHGSLRFVTSHLRFALALIRKKQSA